jgi:hypothetical protein
LSVRKAWKWAHTCRTQPFAQRSRRTKRPARVCKLFFYGP